MNNSSNIENIVVTINEITKYGLNPNLSLEDKERDLEKHLVSLYLLYFGIEFIFDDRDFDDFDKSQFIDIEQNIKSNFADFGFYNTILNINELVNPEIGLGDAVDDLLDIMFDLLEIKWRAENNSINDALWYFKFIFEAHTQQHILDLLNYLKQKETV